MLAVKMETEMLVQSILTTLEERSIASTPAEETTFAAVYRTILRLRGDHTEKDPVFVLAV